MQFTILILVYLVPIVSLIFLPVKLSQRFGRLHFLFGRTEWVFSFLRDGLLAPLLLVYVVYLFFSPSPSPLGGEGWGEGISCLCFVGISIWNFYWRRVRLNGLIDFVIANPRMTPSEFFNYYFASISGLPGRFPGTVLSTISLPIDYSAGRSGISIWPIIPGIITTAIMARLIIRASKSKDDKRCMELTDALSTIWGAVFMKFAGASVEVDGLENLDQVVGRTVFVCNHKSFVDFAVTPLVIGLANAGRKEPFRPRYMAARDHFKDNQFLYRVVGMGRAMERAGTVFVDRRGRRSPATAAINEAVRVIDEKNVDIVIYPQGTRAYGKSFANGKRADAGYYTTGTKERLIVERGHLKKGAAYLAVGAAAKLAEKNTPLYIVPVGLVGTATVAPRGAVRIQRGVHLKVIFGTPMRVEIEHSMLRRKMVEDMHVTIDKMLKETVGVTAGLKKRLAVDVSRTMKEIDIQRVFDAVEAWRSDQDLIFSIIDCIYSLPAVKWQPLIRQLVQMLLETDTPRNEVLGFKRAVIEEMVRNR